MITSKNDLDKRLAQLKKEVPTRGFERHPSMLKNVSELPVELQSPAVSTLAASETIGNIISFPPQIHRGWHYVPKQALIFTDTDVIHLLASIWPGQEPQATYIKGNGIIYMKTTLMLLYGFLEIVAQGKESPMQLGMEFNTLSWDRLFKSLQKTLQATRAASDAPTHEATYSQTAQKAFDELPLKFSNGVKFYGLLPGEKLEDLVFQPGTWKRWLLLFKRPVSANTLLSLSSNYMVVIQEELGLPHGWIITHIPRANIIGIQNRPRGEWNELTVQLKREDQTVETTLLLKSESAQTWQTCWIQHGGQWQDIPGEA